MIQERQETSVVQSVDGHDEDGVRTDIDRQNANGSYRPLYDGSFNGSEDLNELKFIDFFAGAGLARLGLEHAWSCIWANDIDSRKQGVYEAQFGRKDFVLGDVARVATSSLPANADMAWSSFPCQDLSLAGMRQGITAERSGTFWYFWRLMRDLKMRSECPPLIVIENVVGLLYGNNFSTLCEALEDLGMQFGALVMDARLFLPQSRPRVFVVALDSRIDCSAYVHQGVPANTPWVTKSVISAYARLPNALKTSWRWWRLAQPRPQIRQVEEMIEADPIGVDWHNAAETERLLNMMTPLNRAKVDRAHGQQRRVGFIYKRMRNGVQRAEVRFDGLAGCLRTPQGGSSRQIVLVVEDGRIRTRLLSPREAARLMGVPDSFWLPQRYNDAYRAIGDGVAVPVVEWLSKELLVKLSKLCRGNQIEVRYQHEGMADRSRLPGLENVKNQASNPVVPIS